jgi:hypothetical protein
MVRLKVAFVVHHPSGKSDSPLSNAINFSQKKTKKIVASCQPINYTKIILFMTIAAIS